MRGLKNRLDALCRGSGSPDCKRQLRSGIGGAEGFAGYSGNVSHPARRYPGDEKSRNRDRHLAWTQAGGEILFIETLFTKGSGKITVTGRLGDVMKESVQIAISLVKAMFPEKEELFEQNDLHIHVPAEAVPKDGPSAGITLTTALASLVTGKPVHPEIAMTGEVSLRGVVMPIGGLPEKLMAAQRAVVKRVLIPEENTDDLRDVAEEVKQELEMIPVHQVRDVLKLVGILEDEEIAD